jgi:phosphoenolpyruvate synthase/pyruvate phosphate dikinase
MYETFLEVKKKDLEKNIIKAYLSCYDKRVVEYKKEHKFSEDSIKNPKIAVIIQTQIHSEKAGV